MDAIHVVMLEIPLRVPVFEAAHRCHREKTVRGILLEDSKHLYWLRTLRHDRGVRNSRDDPEPEIRSLEVRIWIAIYLSLQYFRMDPT
jgi:hypothetical protein